MKVLISGGGVAGLALAVGLDRLGLDATVVERASRFEALGHFIALKGAGFDAVRELGLEEACRAREASFRQVMMMNAGGRLLRLGSTDEFDQNLGGYILFRRSDLHAALYGALGGGTDLRQGVWITSFRGVGSKVEVDFNDGSEGSFDFVVGADGIHSSVRRKLFGEGYLHAFGGRYLGLTLSYEHGLSTDFERVYFGPGQTVALMPTDPGRVSAIVYHGDGGDPVPEDPRHFRRFLTTAYSHFAPEVLRVFDALDDTSYVFADTIAQVRTPHIVKGRIALIGDAAHSPTFMSGMGSALALQDARSLARHLARTQSPAALLDYQAEMSPIASSYASNARAMRPMLLSRRPWVSSARDAALRVAPAWLMDRGSRDFYSTKGSGVT